ncbi:hypothetical protein STEG23_030801, partial [Scotinomys teguina]
RETVLTHLTWDVFPQSEDTRMATMAPGNVVTEMPLEDLEEPGAWQAYPPALQLMQHQPVFLQEKQHWLFFIPPVMQLRLSSPIRQSGGLSRDR